MFPVWMWTNIVLEKSFSFLTTMHTPNVTGVPLVADAVWYKVGTRVSVKATQSIGGLEKCC